MNGKRCNCKIGAFRDKKEPRSCALTSLIVFRMSWCGVPMYHAIILGSGMPSIKSWMRFFDIINLFLFISLSGLSLSLTYKIYKLN